MEEDKNLEQNSDKSNEKLHISDVINCSTCDWNEIDSIFKPCSICNNYDKYINV
jgi:hypothetical protein